MTHDTPPSYLERLIAEQMRHELASHRLEVVLVPSPVEHWPTGDGGASSASATRPGIGSFVGSIPAAGHGRAAGPNQTR
jgi:hypothetical protein